MFSLTSHTRSLTMSTVLPYLETYKLSSRALTHAQCIKKTRARVRSISHTFQYSTLTLERLHTQGYTDKKKELYMLSHFGEEMYKLYTEHMQKEWKKEWTLCTYTIKEKRKSTREKVRAYLRTYGFIPLSSSVWVYPYTCKAFMSFLEQETKKGEVLFFTLKHTKSCVPYLTHFKS
jgi:hypothetical protein